MIRFYNGRVLTFDGSADITQTEVWTDGGVICYVGAAPEKRPGFEREIDLNGDLLIPGFKDAHTHSGMTFLRSLADDMPLDKWLSEQVWPREARLSPDGLYIMTRLAVMEYLTSGITSCFDMYFHNDAFVRACIDSDFRAVLCGDMNNFDRDYTELEDKFLRYNKTHELISYRLGFHAEYTTSKERMEFVASLVQKYREPMFVHSSETSAEVSGCIERYGVTPTVLFDMLGMYDYGGGGFHCVHMSDEDIEIFKKRGLWAVLNPASNLKLASGIAPVKRFLDEGINLALGTDGAGSNNALDMFREMYLTSVLAKYRERDASAVDALSVLKMACVGGARAIGLDDCDAIAVGKKADLAVIDLHKPNMRPINNIAKNIVYSGSKDNVRLTMVNGRVLYENGEFFIGEDAGRIYDEAEKIMETIRS